MLDLVVGIPETYVVSPAMLIDPRVAEEVGDVFLEQVVRPCHDVHQLVHNQIGGDVCGHAQKVGALDTGLQIVLVLAANFRNGKLELSVGPIVVPEIEVKLRP